MGKPKTEVISCRPRLDFFAEDFELLVITKKTAARKAILIATVPEKVRCQKLGAQVRVGLFFEKKLEAFRTQNVLNLILVEKVITLVGQA